MSKKNFIFNSHHFDGMPMQERLSVETYYRLMIQEVLPSNCERALWLDTDIIVRKSLSELYNLDFVGKYIAACTYSVGRKQKPDFNAGVILYNLKKIRDDGITLRYYLSQAEKLGKDYYLDQDILHAAFDYKKDILFVEKWKYNFTYGFYKRFCRELTLCDFNMDDVSIIPYPGPGIRPWQVEISVIEKVLGKKKKFQCY